MGRAKIWQLSDEWTHWTSRTVTRAGVAATTTEWVQIAEVSRYRLISYENRKIASYRILVEARTTGVVNKIAQSSQSYLLIYPPLDTHTEPIHPDDIVDCSWWKTWAHCKPDPFHIAKKPYCCSGKVLICRNIYRVLRLPTITSFTCN